MFWLGEFELEVQLSTNSATKQTIYLSINLLAARKFSSPRSLTTQQLDTLYQIYCKLEDNERFVDCQHYLRPGFLFFRRNVMSCLSSSVYLEGDFVIFGSCVGVHVSGNSLIYWLQHPSIQIIAPEPPVRSPWHTVTEWGSTRADRAARSSPCKVRQ